MIFGSIATLIAAVVLLGVLLVTQSRRHVREVANLNALGETTSRRLRSSHELNKELQENFDRCMEMSGDFQREAAQEREQRQKTEAALRAIRHDRDTLRRLIGSRDEDAGKRLAEQLLEKDFRLERLEGLLESIGQMAVEGRGGDWQRGCAAGMFEQADAPKCSVDSAVIDPDEFCVTKL